MSQLEYDFCRKYVIEFLAIINYPVDDDSVELIEKYREQALFEVERIYKGSPLYASAIKEVNDDYNRQLYDYVEDKVAFVDKGFFNSIISNMNKLLMAYRNYALRLGMKVPAENIENYYGNYLIALERTLRFEINPTLK